MANPEPQYGQVRHGLVGIIDDFRTFARWPDLWKPLILQRIPALRPCFMCPHTKWSHRPDGCTKCCCTVPPQAIDTIYARCNGRII